VKVAILTDGKPGHLSQAVAVSHALGDRSPEIVRVEIRSSWADTLARTLSVSLPLDHPLLMALIKRAYRVGEVPRAKVLIACGTITALPTLLSAHRTGAKAVSIMVPSLVGPRAFDAVLAPQHDRIEGHNVVQLAVAPCIPEVEAVGEARQHCLKHWGGEEPERFWALVLGGPAKDYQPSFELLRELFLELEERARLSMTKLAVSTSRRTPPEWEELILERVAKNRYTFLPPVLVSRLGEEAFNPLPYWFARAERVFITEESVSMISEAIAYGARPTLFRLDPKLGGKRLLFILNLVERGLISAASRPAELALVLEHLPPEVVRGEPIVKPPWVEKLWKLLS